LYPVGVSADYGQEVIDGHVAPEVKVPLSVSQRDCETSTHPVWPNCWTQQAPVLGITFEQLTDEPHAEAWATVPPRLSHCDFWIFWQMLAETQQGLTLAQLTLEQLWLN
jgi:hypothetical protein